MRPRIAVVVMALLLPGLAVGAQGSAQSPVTEANRCDLLPETADSADVEVHLALGPADLPSRDWYGERRVISPTQARRLGAVLDAFRARFPVSTLVAPDLKRPLDAADLDYVKPLDASLPSLWNGTDFTLHRDGRVSALRTDRPSRSPALDSLIVSTLAGLGAERALGSWPTDSAAEAPPEPDSIRLTLEMRYFANDAVATAPLGWIRVPRYDMKPALVVKGFPQPKFPAELRDEKVQGDVLVQVVVDSVGRADMRTAIVLRATHFDFARAVFDVLPDFKFHVAKINGCSVKQLVQIPFAFRLRQ